jgi:small-conductance mechanosensitive channel
MVPTKAIGADPSAIVATLTGRLSALDAAVAEERRKATERETARNTELEATTKKVHMEIDAMEQRCAAFRRELAAATERVQQRTAAERGVSAAFDARARGEADRLQALRDFLAPPGATAPASASTKATAKATTMTTGKTTTKP